MIMAGSLCLVGSIGVVGRAEASPMDAGLAKKITHLMSDSRVQRAKSSVVVMDAVDGRELYGRYATRATTPASNTKILTAVAAMHHGLTGTRAADNAKTGSLTGVTALSGYVSGRDGRKYVFSMLSHYRSSTPQPVENSLVLALANWQP